MADAVSMRRAGPSDVAALVALQREAYAWNRSVLGVEPLPLMADYAEVVASKECWLAERETRLLGALILEPEAEALLIWSVAVAPAGQGEKLGRRLMDFAEARARDQGFCATALYTGQKLEKNIAWYQRLGYAITGIEVLADRNIVHMKKPVTAKQRERV